MSEHNSVRKEYAEQAAVALRQLSPDQMALALSKPGAYEKLIINGQIDDEVRNAIRKFSPDQKAALEGDQGAVERIQQKLNAMRPDGNPSADANNNPAPG